ncbi:MAG: glycosyltransferase N-terminal domain-containing protein [Saprospiraceae bacterium]|nr:glycosyltransferase N-terminal domain-containing protein [Saprospiraceae bacterium]
MKKSFINPMIAYLYTGFIFFYSLIVHSLSFFNDKAKDRVNGVKRTKVEYKNIDFKEDSKTILIHCASQGEHEQAIPIIRWILANSSWNILLSFFSPSGYNYADYTKESRITKAYLPFDLPAEMNAFVDAYQPSLVIIIKNEWWWNLLACLNKKGISAFLVSATIRKNHYFIRLPLSFFKDRLAAFNKIFVTNHASKESLTCVYKNEILVSGDTRLDQVTYIKQNLSEIGCKFTFNKTTTIVYGSVWQSDLKIVKRIVRHYPSANHLIYPHKLNESNVLKLQEALENSKLISSITEHSSGISIVTAMGELKSAYNYADLAYIGGGFGAGIHNVLEAAVYGIPTFFGSNYKKAAEAKELIDMKCAFSLSEKKDSELLFTILQQEKALKEIEKKLKSYFSPKNSPLSIISKELVKKIDVHV